MITNKRKISYSEQYLCSRGLSPDTCVFFDIETTGFKASTSQLYLVGAAFRSPQSTAEASREWTICQWMAENAREEAELLREFAAFLQGFETLLHFNGKRFDIPYMEEKYGQHQLASPFSQLKSVDLYQDFRPLKSFLKLERMNQKSLELFLGLERDDKYDGGKLIPVYREFCKTRSQEALGLLLLHNQEDVSGMFTLTSLYGYLNFLQDNHRQPSARLLTGKNGRQELLLSFPLKTPVPVPVSHASDWGYLTIKENTGKLLLPVSEGTFYYFFPDYKNYYYLPQEDQAIHKSVASYVDKQYRQPAKADNCYTKKYGCFLPQPNGLFSPVFRRSYQDPVQWFSWEDALLQNPEKLTLYLNTLLSQMTKEF